MKNLIRVMVLLFCIFLLPAAIKGQYTPPKTGDVYQSFNINLNGLEKVIIKVYKVDENIGFFGQIIAFNSANRIIWAGPKNSDIEDPMTFGSWDYGSSLIQIIGDIEGNNSVEIIATKPVSDVRFTPFKLLRWNGKEFYPVYKYTALVENPAGSGKYPWGTKQGYIGRWISEFKSLNGDGTCLVNITEFSSDSSGKQGEALVATDSKGFHIYKWVKSLK